MSSHVPPVRFTPQGLQIPTETEVLNGVLADFNDAFGGGLNLNLETPQGQLASSLAAVIADKNDLIAELLAAQTCYRFGGGVRVCRAARHTDSAGVYRAGFSGQPMGFAAGSRHPYRR